MHGPMVQGGAASVAAYLETAHPLSYLIYMLGAGVGLPVSMRLFARARSSISSGPCHGVTMLRDTAL